MNKDKDPGESTDTGRKELTPFEQLIMQAGDEAMKEIKERLARGDYDKEGRDIERTNPDP